MAASSGAALLCWPCLCEKELSRGLPHWVVLLKGLLARRLVGCVGCVGCVLVDLSCLGMSLAVGRCL